MRGSRSRPFGMPYPACRSTRLRTRSERTESERTGSCLRADTPVLRVAQIGACRASGGFIAMFDHLASLTGLFLKVHIRLERLSHDATFMSIYYVL